MVYSYRQEGVKKIAVIGNYLPRKCGIATFTTDLCNALALEMKNDEDLIAVAMDDRLEGYDYPERVKFRIRENVQSDYFWAANFLNANQYDLVILQHEYGIFGGNEGSHILSLLNALNMPVLTNLHTVLKNPTEEQKNVIKEIAGASKRLLVMSEKAVELLKENYGIAKSDIVFIPHGIPDVSFENPGIYNDLFGFAEKEVILTFGLLSPNKGIEEMIKAMPKILEKHPNSIYVVLGQTHPHIQQKEGHAYKHSLQQLAKSLKVGDQVRFHSHFVDMETLIQFLQTATIYAIPYLNKEQITSGTLAYALGVGTPVVSTPFWHAKELLANGRGITVPFKNPNAMAEEIIKLLDNESDRNMMRMKAYHFARSMTWKEVARKHLQLAMSVIEERPAISKMNEDIEKTYQILDELPEINFTHMKNLTDDTGILQHAKYSVPNLHHGYCVDDNARALIATSIYYNIRKDQSIIAFIQKYLAFLNYAFNTENGRFRNFMSYDRKWLELFGSEDAHGRAIWALGITVKYAPDNSIRNMSMRLFRDGISYTTKLVSPRALAFTIIGIQKYLQVFSGDASVCKIRDLLAKRLFALFIKNMTEDWPWCEDTLTYSNAKLPHALIIAGNAMDDQEMFDTGIKSLKWLLKIQTSKEGHLSIIGNDKWYRKNHKKSKFDQQPIEAMSLIDACLDANFLTKDSFWMKESDKCFAWFMGRNDISVPLYDFVTKGCFDGLEAQTVNLNLGAESTLAWLISLLRMYEALATY